MACDCPCLRVFHINHNHAACLTSRRICQRHTGQRDHARGVLNARHRAEIQAGIGHDIVLIDHIDRRGGFGIKRNTTRQGIKGRGQINILIGLIRTRCRLPVFQIIFIICDSLIDRIDHILNRLELGLHAQNRQRHTCGRRIRIKIAMRRCIIIFEDRNPVDGHIGIQNGHILIGNGQGRQVHNSGVGSQRGRASGSPCNRFAGNRTDALKACDLRRGGILVDLHIDPQNFADRLHDRRIINIGSRIINRGNRAIDHQFRNIRLAVQNRGITPCDTVQRQAVFKLRGDPVIADHCLVIADDRNQCRIQFAIGIELTGNCNGWRLRRRPRA